MNIWRTNKSGALGATLGMAATVFATACGNAADGAHTQTAEPDSALQSILGTVAAAPAPEPTSPRISLQEQDAQPVDITVLGYNVGSPSTDLKVIELSDFGCGYCRRFHEEIFPTLKKIYVDGGYLEWKFIPYVLGMFPNGLEAAIAAECAGEQEQFFPMQGRLFAEQGQWKSSADPFPLFAQLATEEGLDVERYTTCIDAGWRDARLRSNLRFGQMVGVRGTPTFMVDGRPIEGSIPLDQFRAVLDTALRQKGITPPGG